MVSLKQVDLTMFPQFYPLLREINPELSEAEWYRVFTPEWDRFEDFCGYGLFDGAEMVGFLGFIFSQRTIDGQLEKFCNLTSWIVRESHKGHSISLMLALRKLKGYTITDLSATERAIEVAKRLGFQELDDRVTVLPSIPLTIFSRQPKLKIITEKSLIYQKLSPQEQKIFADHKAQPRCHHLLAETADRSCYIIFNLVKNAKFPFSHIQYLGNAELFVRHSLAIRQAIALRVQNPWVIIDHRMLKGLKPNFCFSLPIEVCRLYKSSTVKPEQIDNLYSELVIIDFNSIPSFTWSKVKSYYKKHYLKSNS